MGPDTHNPAASCPADTPKTRKPKNVLPPMDEDEVIQDIDWEHEA